VPPNRKPLGAEHICSKDGFILMKVPERDPHTGFPTRYKHKHVHIWEQAHGPVPYKNTPDSIKPSVLALSTLEVKTWKREKGHIGISK